MEVEIIEIRIKIEAEMIEMEVDMIFGHSRVLSGLYLGAFGRFGLTV